MRKLCKLIYHYCHSRKGRKAVNYYLRVCVPLVFRKMRSGSTREEIMALPEWDKYRELARDSREGK